MNKGGVELIEKQTAFRGYFRIDRLRLRFPLYEGGMSREVVREVLERGQVAAVLLVDPDRDCVVLIEQFRPGPYAAGEQPWLIEAVAGVIEGTENAEEMARREAREEANCEITDLFPIMRFFTSPGASTESVALFCGRVDSTDAGGVHGLEEEGEDIRVLVVPVMEALSLLHEGKIVNAKTIIALQWLASNYDKIKKRWLTSD
ncbi:MAG: NUDIX domain-containing protein [Gammaproteobacteria bacterium]|nr:MAG: NUDIX domain-containing protein [Gammaproteobacteria bacterium]